MKFLDGEMTADEQHQFEEHVKGCEICEAELRDMGRVVNLTSEIRLKQPEEAFWEDYWRGIYRRTERGLGFFLIAAGLGVLTAFGMLKAVTSPEFWTVKGLSGAALILGLWIVFLSVVRERYHEQKNDPYKEVQR
jgi:hypothetical protein